MERRLQELLPESGFNASPTRSATMAAVRHKGNKSTERRLRAALVSASIRGWTMHPNNVTGKPDFYFAQSRVAVFVDGCFWHGCPSCGHTPKKNRAFWKAKITRNQLRDRETTLRLRRHGVSVLRFWEHELADDLDECVGRITRKLRSRSSRPR